MKKKDMHTSNVRTRHQLKNEKSRKYKPKRKFVLPTYESFHVEKEKELGPNITRMPFEENEVPCAENEMHEENEMPCKDNEMREGNETPCNENEMHEEIEMQEECEMACEENVVTEMEIRRSVEADIPNVNVKKRGRGPTKIKRLPLNFESRIEVEFNEAGVPIGEGSVRLSSYLGPLVREHVPVTLIDWRLLSDELKTVLWDSIQARFKVEDEWQKTTIFQQMGTIWRTSKSRLVRKIIRATTEEERLALKPYNIKNVTDWRKFVKEKTSLE